MATDANGIEDMDIAYAVTDQLWKAFQLEDVIGEISPSLYDEVIIETLTQHREHIKVHKIEPKALDPYKFACWFGCAVLGKVTIVENDDSDRCNFTKASKALVRSLSGMIHIDSKYTVKVPERTISLLIRMLREEKKRNYNHGLWQNGLYAAFHTTVSVSAWDIK